MAWSKNDSAGSDHRRTRSAGRRGYHHGNLRAALIKAAVKLIQDKGPAGFTFADAARAAGVSAAAPYRHFKDRDALLAGVAQEGFTAFETALEAAWDQGKPTTQAAFQNIGNAYLAFAKDAPAYYAAMFESGLPADLNPDLRRAGDRAFAVLQRATEALLTEHPGAQKPPALMVALHIWSLSHGIASLFGRGDDASRALPMPPEELLEAAVLIYLRGLGLSGL